MTEVIVAIDPGREKCGVAIVSVAGETMRKAIVDVAELGAFVSRKARHPDYSIIAYAIGDRTGTDHVIDELRTAGVPPEAIQTVDEHRSSEVGRQRFWEENRPKGWRRLLPTGLQVPPVPYDDYVAVELAYRYLASSGHDAKRVRSQKRRN